MSREEEMSKKKSNGYWQDLKNVKRELESLEKRVGHFPSLSEIRKNLPSAYSAIFEYHGGIERVGSVLGIARSIKKGGYWQNWNNVEMELNLVINDLGHFPTQKDLKLLKMTSMTTSIYQYHGGLTETKKRMGYEDKTKPPGYWQDWDNFQRELSEAISIVGHFPSSRELRDLGKNSLIKAHGYHGGAASIKKRINFPDDSPKPRNHWKSWKNISNELKRVADRLGHFPSQGELVNQGYSGLNSSIVRNHGGLANVREKMGFGESSKNRGYWQQWKNIEIELKAVIEEIGHFPSQKELAEKGLSSLSVSAVKYFGGITSVRKRMGYEEGFKPAGYWQNWNNVERELNQVIDELGYFPTGTDIKRIGKKGLEAAIYKHHGGLNAVRKKIGHEEAQQNQGDLEDLLKQYIFGKNQD